MATDRPTVGVAAVGKMPAMVSIGTVTATR